MNSISVDSRCIKRILIVALCGIGDFLFFMPTLTSLRSYFKDTEIDLLTFPSGLDSLVKESSLVDNILIFPFYKYWSNKNNNIREYIEIVKMIKQIKRRKYDISIWPFAHTTFKKKMLSVLFNARLNVMHNKNISIWDKIFYNTIWVPFHEGIHSVKLNQYLIKPLGLKVEDEEIKIKLSEDSIIFGKNFLEKLLKRIKKMILGIHPGGKILWSSYRLWGIEKFAYLADKISEKYDAFTLIFGTRNERSILEGVKNLMKSESIIVDNLTLVQVASVIKHLSLFIGNDSALVHIAASLGVKSVSITGPTNFERTGPWGKNSYVVRIGMSCSPCFDRDLVKHCSHRVCLAKLEPEEVFYVINKIVSDNNIKESLEPYVFNLPLNSNI